MGAYDPHPQHVENGIKEAATDYSALSSLQKLKNILPQSKLDQVYKAMSESHLRYSNEIWGSLSNTKLEHLQRFFIK